MPALRRSSRRVSAGPERAPRQECLAGRPAPRPNAGAGRCLFHDGHSIIPYFQDGRIRCGWGIACTEPPPGRAIAGTGTLEKGIPGAPSVGAHAPVELPGPAVRRLARNPLAVMHQEAADEGGRTPGTGL